MTLSKDTIIKAIIEGIYISVTFDDSGEIIKFEELYTNYLDGINLEQIKHLTYNSKSKINGTFKACLTIKRSDLCLAFKLYNDRDVFNDIPDFKKLIMDCLKDKEYINYVSFIMCGNINDDEEYDELYNCVLCKYFSKFNVSPKMKLRFDLSNDDFKIILHNWLETYIFYSVLINCSHEYSIYEYCDKLIITENDIIWKGDKNYLVPYIAINLKLYQLSIYDIYATCNSQLVKNAYYRLNGIIVSNNIFKTLGETLLKRR